MLQQEFAHIVTLIKQSQYAATKAVNTELLNLYWQIGGYINQQLALASWGDKTISDLAGFIAAQHPELKGFSRQGLYRMKQFYETYSHSSIVSAPLRQLQNTENQSIEIVSTVLTQFNIPDIRDSKLSKLSWSHHLSIMSRTKSDEERLFYINICINENYSTRELDRQISASLISPR